MGELDEKLIQLEKNQQRERNSQRQDEKKGPTFEELIEQMDSEEKKDAARAQLRLRKAEYEERIRQLEARAGGSKMNEPTNPASGEKPKRWDVVDGKLIEDADGAYETFAQAYKAASLEATKASDPTSFFKFLKTEGFLDTGKKDEFMTRFMSELASRSVENLIRPTTSAGGDGAIKSLQAELASLREEVRRSSDPIESAKRVKELFDSLKAVGLIPEPSASGEDSIEHLREKYRHEEKIKELDNDSQYKDKLTATFSEIPERIGKGLASQISEEEEEPSSGDKSRLKAFRCECGHDIVIPPEAGPTITCGKCGAIYSRDKPVPESEDTT